MSSRPSARKSTAKFPELSSPSASQPQDQPQPQPLIFSIDPRTLLFETHKSEDVSSLKNRVSLIEIHEVLMHINMKLLPVSKVFHAFSSVFMLIMIVTLVLTILLILLQDLRFLSPVLIGFLITQTWICLRSFVRKFTYKQIINKFLKTIHEVYKIRGLTWRVRTVLFTCENRFPCWLELQCITEKVPTIEKSHENLETKISVKEISRTKERKTTTGLKTAWNLTLGPNASRNMSFNIPTAVYTVVDVVSPETVRTDAENNNSKSNEL